MKPDALSDYPIVITLPILWADQDAFGHVNNTISLRWFESSRIAYVEQSEFGQLMDDGGMAPILAAVTCNYRKQLHYPDTVHLGVRVGKLGRSSMIMEHAIYSEKLDAIASDGTSTVVVFDYKTNRPQRISDEMRLACEKLEGRSFDTSG